MIEKCISQYSKDFKYRALQEIIKNDTVGEFMKNKYSNFILHKLIIFNVKREEYQIIIDKIQKNINNVHMAKFKNQWQKFLEKASDMNMLEDVQF